MTRKVITEEVIDSVETVKKEIEHESRTILQILTSTVFILITIGTVFYHFVEGFDWVDAYYFTVITLTTVGYGDIVPTTDIGKIFTTVYVFFGVGIIGAFISEYATHRLGKKN